MLRIYSTLFLLLGIVPGAADPAQNGAICSTTALGKADDRVLRTPSSAQRRFTSVEKLADGATRRSASGESEARDSLRRTYTAGERHWTYLDNGKSALGIEMLYRIHDPVSNTDTGWDSTSREVKVIHWSTGAPGVFADSALSAFLTAVSGTVVEKLGATTIEGVVAEGTGPERQGPGVVHENWYCPKLKIVASKRTTIRVAGRLRMRWWASFEESPTSRNIAHPRITLFTTCNCQPDKRRHR